MTGAQRRSRSGAKIEIRPLRTEAELRQCVALQRATWGAHYEDLVPPSILIVAQKIGGIAAGAFDHDDDMIGFVFGMAGVRRGEIIHWSDMLAVREDARDRGIGKQLKEYQRSAAKASGAVTMYWTYDPLAARNAHLNFNQLGVTVDEYVEDMYGASESDLHRGLGTDRFVVAWALDADRGTARRAGAAPLADAGTAIVLNPDAEAMSASQLEALDAAAPASVRVEIPLDIVAVRDSAPDDAVRWRSSTRQAFEWALGRGYQVTRFATDRPRERGHYYMTRASARARP